LHRYALQNTTMPLIKNHAVMCRLWIEGKDCTFLGNGRIELLEAIKEHGSISGASRSMKMSYKKALKLIDAMNAESKNPLVISSTGGKNGGGAQLTESGEKMMHNFIAFREKCFQFINTEIEKYDFT